MKILKSVLAGGFVAGGLVCGASAANDGFFFGVEGAGDYSFARFKNSEIPTKYSHGAWDLGLKAGYQASEHRFYLSYNYQGAMKSNNVEWGGHKVLAGVDFRPNITSNTHFLGGLYAGVAFTSIDDSYPTASSKSYSIRNGVIGARAGLSVDLDENNSFDVGVKAEWLTRAKLNNDDSKKTHSRADINNLGLFVGYSYKF